MNIRNLVIAVFLVSLFGFGFLLLNPTNNTFKLIDGNSLTDNDLKGKVTLVNFWSVNCPPCIKEMPDLNQLFQQYNKEGVQFIGVAMPYDPPNIVIKFTRNLKIQYPIALDIDQKLASRFNVNVVPTTFLLDKSGNIKHKIIGTINLDKISQQLYELNSQ